MFSPARWRHRTKITRTALLAAIVLQACLPSAVAKKPKDRVIDPQKPDQTVPIDPGEAKSTELMEGLLGKMATAESKVETGEMKQEDYSKLIESAVETTEAAVQSYPESPAVLLSASRVMSQAGRYDQAISYADHAAALAPRDPWPVVNKGIAQFEQCDFPAAAGTARQALKRDSSNQNAIALWNLSQRPAGCNNVTDRLQSRFLGGKMRELGLPGRTPSLDFLGGAGLGDGLPADADRPAVSGIPRSIGTPMRTFSGSRRS